MLLPGYQMTWCYIPQDSNLNIHYCENLEFHETRNHENLYPIIDNTEIPDMFFSITF
jgi:hypothetical protein